MKKLLIFIGVLFAVSTLSAQTYKVGDIYDVDGKKGVVFEVSEDGKHGKIIADGMVSEKMTWDKAMEYGRQLKDGWYIPSYEEMMVLMKVFEEVTPKITEVRGTFWTTTEFNPDCAWMFYLKADSRGGMYKANLLQVKPISKF